VPQNGTPSVTIQHGPITRLDEITDPPSVTDDDWWGSEFRFASPLDINADGKSDLVFCLYGYAATPGDWGSDVYIFLDPACEQRDVSEADIVLRTPTGLDALDLGLPGDVNGDGHDDLMVFLEDVSGEAEVEYTTSIIYGGEDFVERMQAAAE